MKRLTLMKQDHTKPIAVAAMLTAKVLASARVMAATT